MNNEMEDVLDGSGGDTSTDDVPELTSPVPSLTDGKEHVVEEHLQLSEGNTSSEEEEEEEEESFEVSGEFEEEEESVEVSGEFEDEEESAEVSGEFEEEEEESVEVSADSEDEEEEESEASGEYEEEEESESESGLESSSHGESSPGTSPLASQSSVEGIGSPKHELFVDVSHEQEEAAMDGKPSNKLEELLLKQQEDRVHEKEEAAKKKQSPEKPPFSPFSVGSGGSEAQSFQWDKESPQHKKMENVDIGSPVDEKAQKDIILSVKNAIEKTHSRLYDAFLIMDKSKKGTLTKAELFRGLCGLDIGIERSVLSQFVDSVDMDRDNLISFQEFFNVFETGHVNFSKQSWSPPSPNRNMFSPNNNNNNSNNGVEDDDDEEEDQNETIMEADETILEDDDEEEEDAEEELLSSGTASVGLKKLEIKPSFSRHETEDTHTSIESSPTRVMRIGTVADAPNKKAAEYGTLKVTIHQARDLIDPSKPGTKPTELYCTCKLNRDKFKTEISRGAENPVWDCEHIYGVGSSGGGGTTKNSNASTRLTSFLSSSHGLPFQGKLAVLHIRVKNVDSWVKGHEIGAVSIPVWDLLHDHDHVVKEGNEQLVVKKWFNLINTSVGSPKKKLFGLRLPSSPKSGKSSPAQSPKSSDDAVVGQLQVTLDLSFPGLEIVRSEPRFARAKSPTLDVMLMQRDDGDDEEEEDDVHDEVPLEEQEPTQMISRSRTTSETTRGSPRSPEFKQAQHDLIQAKLEIERANRRTKEVIRQVEQETKLRLEAEERAKTMENDLTKSMHKLQEQYQEKEGDLRAEIQLLRLQLQDFNAKHSDHSSSSNNNNNEDDLENALKRREEYERRIHLQNSQITDLEQLNQQIQTQLEQASEVYRKKMENAERTIKDLETRVVDLTSSLNDHEGSVSELETSKIQFQSREEELLRKVQLLDSKLHDALNAKERAEAKRKEVEMEAAHVFADAGKRIEDLHSPRGGSNKEIDRLIETITQLNRVIDQLRESESRAQRELRGANLRVQEHTAELATLAGENEVQARELGRMSEELEKRTAALRKAHQENGNLDRLVLSLKNDLEKAKSDHDLLKRESDGFKELNIRLQGDINTLHEQVSEANERVRLVTNELGELRRYRSGSAAHLHAQSLTIQKLKSEEKATEVLRTINRGLVSRNWQDLVIKPLRSVKDQLADLKAPIRMFPSIVGDALERLNRYKMRQLPKQRMYMDDVDGNLPSYNSNKFTRPIEISDARHSYNVEKKRRRNLHKSRKKSTNVVCTVYQSRGADSLAAASDVNSTLNSKSKAKTPTSVASVWNDQGGVKIQPLPGSNEILVAGETTNRYFGFDQVFVEPKQPTPTGTRGSGNDAKHPSARVLDEILPLVDAFFDGDMVLVLTSGPGANSTTNTIINAMFDVVESYPASSDGGSVTPVISISCIDIFGNQVYDMLANPSENSNLFERIRFDRISAQATGRVNLENAGLTIVEVRSRYEASLVAAMGSGNRAAASASRNMSDMSQDESHLLFTITVESTDPFSGQVVQGKMRVLELSGTTKASDDESIEDLVQILNGLHQTRLEGDEEENNNNNEIKKFLHGRSPGAYSRLFSQSVLLGILRDCIDEKALGMSLGSPDGALFHVLVHCTLTITHTKSIDLLTALHFALRLRTVNQQEKRYAFKNKVMSPFVKRRFGSSNDEDERYEQHDEEEEEERIISNFAEEPFELSPPPPKPNQRKTPVRTTTTYESIHPSFEKKSKKSTGKKKKKTTKSLTPTPTPTPPPPPPLQKLKSSGTETSRATFRVLEALMGQTEGMLHGLFMSMDTGRTGSLSRGEFRRGLHRIDPSLTKKEVELFMDCMDENRDGKIDFHEFFRVLGDARSGNQHQIFLKDKHAYQIALRERKKVREQLSPDRYQQDEKFAFPPGSGSSSASSKFNKVDYGRKIAKTGYLMGYTAPVNFEKSLRK